ncbi:hypothetical protein [Mycobacterium sp. PSTR-4-N]|uniref:zinc finger domain-containing protein n=1 Tax=Mycobacterium sp. PSTR-4-N TaxID=2917745 RepID=UPI001F156AAC|nr:hypothetical protein [Mycobacterium sp. PSTR-4-N]MCG7592415.1 hypothetical protein [Mycobacterium sp. PSTR-4-N]
MTTAGLNYPQIAAAVYQACTTYDQYLPQLSEDVARAWAKTFARFGLTAEQLIRGVDAVYAERGNGYRPLPADIAQAARAIRQDERMREPAAVRDRRMEGLAAKAAEDVVALAERKGVPATTTTFERRGINPASRVKCPWCHAGPGQPCVIPITHKPLRRRQFHDARIEAAQ